jgi:O-antigen ligase
VLDGEALPRVPGTDVPLLHAKSGDILVHLAGIGGFLLGSPRRIGFKWPLLLAFVFALTGVRSRGGLLAFALGLGVVAFSRPLARRLWIGTAASMIGVLLILSADPGISLGGRDLSPRQLLANVTSTFSPTGAIALDGPREWRLEWWSEIIEYTVTGPRFWTGKGFGVNLATADGFDVDAERTLRSPHNGHLTMLARAGVPGFVLWILVQLSWLCQLLRRYRASRRAGQRRWSQLFLFLIAYWLAFLVNASFDVSLEGPMAGIWFWTLFGVGLAAARIHHRCPAVLESGDPAGAGLERAVRRTAPAARWEG